MEQIATENLFLLEFLVDNVNLDPSCMCETPPGEACVSFQFLDNDPLDVCEADFSPNRNMQNDAGEVKSGKSCLFSLSPEQAMAATEQFDICVSILKRMQPGWLPEVIEIGIANISVSNLFNELIECVQQSDGNAPTAKTLKDEFDITDPNAETKLIGKITTYIRMSCFGKLIVTQFQMNLTDKSILFKDQEGKSLYRYKKSKKRDKSADGLLKKSRKSFNRDCPRVPCNTPGETIPDQQMFNQMPNQYNSSFPCPAHPSNGSCLMASRLTTPGYRGPEFPDTGGRGTNTIPMPCNECGYITDPSCLPSTPTGFSAGCMGCAGTQQICGGTGMVPALSFGNYGSGGMGGGGGSKNYQEIGASMGGNSLTIRVHKDKNKIEQIDETNNGDPCICDGGGGGAIVPQSQAMHQQAFNMRPGVPGNSPFSFRMGQYGDMGSGMGGSKGAGNGGGNNIILNPPVSIGPDGTQFAEFSDPNKETFVLRIGKKSEGADKKNNLELELQTPKAPPLKPIPKKETVETQYDQIDVGPADVAVKAGGKKGKKDKGGKGKKKKK